MGLPKGERVARPSETRGLAIGANAPLVMRGPAPVLGWAPPMLKQADPELPQRLTDLLRPHRPAAGARSLAEGIQTGKIASGLDVKARGGPGDPNGMEQMATGAARLLAQPEGPRIAALAFDGWDTHAQELPRLSRLLGGLDVAIASFEKEMGPAWKDTVVVVMTEFGRTAHVNGTQGTDHGTGTVMFLAGGAVRGGRVIADWPACGPTSCATAAISLPRPTHARHREGHHGRPAGRFAGGAGPRRLPRLRERGASARADRLDRLDATDPRRERRNGPWRSAAFPCKPW